MPQATWTSVRIKADTKAFLNEMARSLSMSQGAVIEVALERMRRQQMLESAAMAYDKMREDPGAAKAFDEEFAAWDNIPDEGLENL